MHYSQAPITEAIIDIKVAFPEDFSVDTFANIEHYMGERFPVKEPVYHSTGSIVFQPGSPVEVNTNQQPFGLLFRSQDKLRVFQATFNGFTFNRLAPYESWEEFSSDARYLWQIYKEVSTPLHITRVSLRYINQINIPFESGIDLKEYFNTLPEVTSGLPGKVLSSYFMQVQIPQDDIDCMLVINEALVPPANASNVSVILDFDLYRQHIWQNDDEDIWLFLEKLRHRKNLAFEKSITDKTRRLFD